MFSNQSVDGRADLYSLGIIARKPFQGRFLFDGPTPMAILYKQAHTQAEPLRSKAPHVSRPMAHLVHRLLEKDPALRFENASELEAALAQAGKGHGFGVEGRTDSTCRPFVGGAWILVGSQAPTKSPNKLPDASVAVVQNANVNR